MLIKIVESAVTILKGRPYKIDKGIGFNGLLDIFLTRIFSLLRFFLKFGFRISFLGKRVKIINKSNLLIGQGVTIEDNVTINAISIKKMVISDNVTICKDTIIQGTGVITEIGEGLVIGKGSAIGAMSFVGCQGGVNIGENVIMGPRVNIHSENHNFEDINIPIKDQGVSRKGININNNCWVGAGVIFLDGVTIGEGCVIAAGSVVNKSFPKNSIIAGVPARILKTRTEKFE